MKTIVEVMQKYAEIAIKHAELKKHNTYPDSPEGVRQQGIDVSAKDGHQKQMHILEWFVIDPEGE